MPALIAFIQVTAEGGRPAVTDILECPALLRRQNMSPLFQELLLVCAKDIGQFEPKWRHSSSVMVEAALTTSSGFSRSKGLFVLRAAESTTCR